MNHWKWIILLSFSSCTLLVEIEDRPIPENCGNGTIEEGEACDGANLNERTCADVQPGTIGTLACSAFCEFDASGCHPGENCANGVDDDGDGNVDCGDMDCEYECSPCGDGQAGPHERCDGGDLSGADCMSLGYAGGTLACTAECFFDASGCEGDGRCGNEIVDENLGELCDGPNLAMRDCTDRGFVAGTLACQEDCRAFDYGGCLDKFEDCANGVDDDGDFVKDCADPFCMQAPECTQGCGDGLRQTAEECDGSDVAGYRCNDFFYSGGAMSCANCRLDFSGCTMNTKLDGSYMDLAGGAHHTCAVTNDYIYCWGLNVRGQLGGNYDQKYSPVALRLQKDNTFFPSVGEGAVQAAAAGKNHACAVINYKVYCWGDNTYGQLGLDLGHDAFSLQALEVAGLENVNRIAAGDDFTCALNNSRVYCWGNNTYGQLGNSGPTQAHAPMEVPGIDSAVEIAAGSRHVCVILDSPAPMKCWGFNGFGQLGNGTFTDSAAPVDVLRDGEGNVMQGFQSVVAGAHHTCATADSRLYCWGSDTHGQLGNGSAATDPQVFPSFAIGSDQAVVRAAAAYGDTTCAAVIENGSPFPKLYCWGDNAYGQANPNSSNPMEPSPVVVLSDMTVHSISVGAMHACVSGQGNIAGTMEITCWGSNRFGQAGATAPQDARVLPKAFYLQKHQ